MLENFFFECVWCFFLVLCYCQVLGLMVEVVDEKGLILCLFYSQVIIGNLESGVVYGGVIIILMDIICGIFMVCVLLDFEICLMFDLCIDYMYFVELYKDVYGFVECYWVMLNVIFICGFVYQDDLGQFIVYVVGVFMCMGGLVCVGVVRLVVQGGVV